MASRKSERRLQNFARGLKVNQCQTASKINPRNARPFYCRVSPVIDEWSALVHCRPFGDR